MLLGIKLASGITSIRDSSKKLRLSEQNPHQHAAFYPVLLTRIIHRLLVARRVSEGGETNYPRLRVGLPKRIVRSKPRTDE